MSIQLSKEFYSKKNGKSGEEFIGVQTNAQQVFTNISNLIRSIKDEAENLSEWSARELVDEARNNLKNSRYNVEGLLKNITWEEHKTKQYYTVAVKNNEDRDKMYYLEYGTGFVGEKKPHKLARDVGWRYVINEGAEWYFDANNMDTFSENHNIGSTDTNRLGEDVGDKGWFYKDENGTLQITSGLKAVAYMYNAFDKFNDPNGPYERALARTKIKSIIKAGK